MGTKLTDTTIVQLDVFFAAVKHSPVMGSNESVKHIRNTREYFNNKTSIMSKIDGVVGRRTEQLRGIYLRKMIA